MGILADLMQEPLSVISDKVHEPDMIYRSESKSATPVRICFQCEKLVPDFDVAVVWAFKARS